MTPTAGSLPAARAARPAIPATAAGLVLALGAFFVFWYAANGFNAGRGDFFWLADAFLHGRTWVTPPYAIETVNDVIVIDGRNYVPFAPFPAIVLMPLVALIGPAAAAVGNAICISRSV